MEQWRNDDELWGREPVASAPSSSSGSFFSLEETSFPSFPSHARRRELEALPPISLEEQRKEKSGRGKEGTQERSLAFHRAHPSLTSALLPLFLDLSPKRTTPSTSSTLSLLRQTSPPRLTTSRRVSSRAVTLSLNPSSGESCFLLSLDSSSLCV